MNFAFILIGILILYVPNQLHLPADLGVKGLNVFNMLFLLTLMAVLTQQHRQPDGNGSSNPLKIPLVLYYLMLTVALFTAFFDGHGHFMADLTIYKTAIIYSSLYFLAYFGVNRPDQVRMLFFLILVVYCVAALEAVREGFAYGFGNFAHSKRAAGPFSQGSANANYAGVFYSVFAPVWLLLALDKSRRAKHRLAGLAAYLLGCLAVLATFSRQSFVIIAVVTLLAAMRRNVWLAAAATLVIVNYAIWAPEGVVERIAMTTQQTEFGTEELEDSAESRYELWAGALQIIERRPLGIGLNQFQDEIEPYLPDWVKARDAQNQYLRIAAEAGIQGLAAFVVLLLALLVTGIRIARQAAGDETRLAGAGLVLATIGVMMGNIYSSTFFSGEVMGVFWIFAGLVARLHELEASEKAGVKSTQPAPAPVERLRSVYARWQHFGKG